MLYWTKIGKKSSTRAGNIFGRRSLGIDYPIIIMSRTVFSTFAKVDHTRKSLFFRILSDNEAYRNVVMNNEFDISLSRYQFKRVVFTIF